MKNLVLQEAVERKIYLIRGQKVILDKDLASLYGVKTKNLNLQVKRNIRRFPEDFMFQLSKDESLRLHFETSKRGGRRYLPYVFTELGVGMLSSVLNSERAIQVNMAIMRAFARLGAVLSTHRKLAAKIETLELKYKHHDLKLSEYDTQIAAIFEAIKQLMMPAAVPVKPQIGFHK